MAASATWVVGGHQTDFARSRARAGLGFAELVEDVVTDHFGITAPGESWKAVESGELRGRGRATSGQGAPHGCRDRRSRAVDPARGR